MAAKPAAAVSEKKRASDHFAPVGDALLLGLERDHGPLRRAVGEAVGAHPEAFARLLDQALAPEGVVPDGSSGKSQDGPDVAALLVKKHEAHAAHVVHRRNVPEELASLGGPLDHDVRPVGNPPVEPERAAVVAGLEPPGRAPGPRRTGGGRVGSRALQ